MSDDLKNCKEQKGTEVEYRFCPSLNKTAGSPVAQISFLFGHGYDTFYLIKARELNFRSALFLFCHVQYVCSA